MGIEAERVPLGKTLYQPAEGADCSQCGEALPPGAKFCSECGTSMQPGDDSEILQIVGKREWSLSEATAEIRELEAALIPEMLLIPESWFVRGSPLNEGNDNETPQRRIWLDEYFIGKYTVTNHQYREFVCQTGYRYPRLWGNRRFNQDNQPVVGVSWEDAMAYCIWLSRVTGRSFTLPSEAQWEKTARGEDARKYPWGNARPSPRRAHFSHRKSLKQPSPAASHPKGNSPYGAVNMAGNVLEWCLDVYQKDYYAASPERNPMNRGAPELQAAVGQARRRVSHVLRGGSWMGACTPITYRYMTYVSNLSNVGFRCVELPSAPDGGDEMN